MSSGDNAMMAMMAQMKEMFEALNTRITNMEKANPTTTKNLEKMVQVKLTFVLQVPSTLVFVLRE